jgi:molecular chaperone DnaJ
VRTYKKIKLEIPKGVEDGMTLQLRGEGEPSEGGQAGDLLIRIHVKPHPVFERLADGHILYNLDTSFTDLALGTDRRVPTLDGDEKLKINAGSQPNNVVKLKGKGLPRYGGFGKGDELVRLNIKVPTQLSDTQKELLRQLDREFKSPDGR